jgi:hypothetical protein
VVVVPWDKYLPCEHLSRAEASFLHHCVVEKTQCHAVIAVELVLAVGEEE